MSKKRGVFVKDEGFAALVLDARISGFGVIQVTIESVENDPLALRAYSDVLVVASVVLIDFIVLKASSVQAVQLEALVITLPYVSEYLQG